MYILHDRNALYELPQIFFTTPLPQQAPNPFLLLTRPFVDDGIFEDYPAQLAFYQKLLGQYAAGYTVFIKPHPRDEADYGAAFPDAVVLDKNMPSEILNVVFPFRFKRALTVASQSFGTLTCVDEKLLLSLEEAIGADTDEAFHQRMLKRQQ